MGGGLVKLLAGLVALACLLVIGLTWSCNAVFPEADVEELHARVDSLVPAGAAVIQREDGGCVELALYPDCVITAFYVDAGLATRSHLAVDRARENGWACGSIAVMLGGNSIACDKDEYHAEIVLWPDPVRSCKGRPLNDCPGQYDHVQVTRRG